MNRSPRPAPEDGPLQDPFDLAGAGKYALLVVRSLRRHKLLFLGIWLGVVGASLGAMAVLPKTYEVETTLQAQRAQVIAALGNGSAPSEADHPTKQAAETVLRHDNLVSLVKQTELIKRWPLHRAPLMRFKDSLWRRFFPAPRAEDQVEAFVGLLENKLWVKTSEGIVTIGIRLADAQLAFNLVEAALQNFLEARHAAELSAIADAISILEARSAQAHDVLEKSQERLRTLRSARAVKLGRRGVRRGGELVPPALPDQQTSKLVVQAEIKRRAIGDLEEFRRRRIAELETRLQEQRAIYSESHPVVLDLQQSLDAMRKESTQVAALRRELLPLESELKQRGLLSDVPLRASRARDVAMQTAALEAEDPREDEDAEIDYAKSQARHALSRYNGMLDRIDMARLEEDTAQAAFKYRYVVIRPAQTPRGPVTPKPPLILGASLLAGLFLGVIGTSLVDLSSRKVVEAWQVEHALGLPLLGEVRDL